MQHPYITRVTCTYATYCMRIYVHINCITHTCVHTLVHALAREGLRFGFGFDIVHVQHKCNIRESLLTRVVITYRGYMALLDIHVVGFSIKLHGLTARSYFPRSHSLHSFTLLVCSPPSLSFSLYTAQFHFPGK